MNARRVPSRYQEELLGSVNALLESISCAPAMEGPSEETPAQDARSLAGWLRENSG